MLRLCLLLWLLPYSFLQAALVIEQPITLNTSSGQLRGSLLLPASAKPVPLAILHQGSGPTDRNGNQPQARNDSMRKLARALAEQGIASLRYDKRGVAASLAAEPDEQNLTIERYRDDLIAWSHWLKQDPRFAQQILIGHSEGALITSLAAPHTRAQALVLIAGSGQPIDQLLLKQLAPRVSPRQLQYQAQLIRQIKAGLYPQVVPASLAFLLRPSVQPYLYSLFQYDPAAVFAQTQQAALIVQGDHDVQVSIDDAQLLSQARPDAQLAIIPAMDHVLRNAQEEPLANYNRSDLPLSKPLLSQLFLFLADQGILSIEVSSAAADSPSSAPFSHKNSP